jgi:hypothetical protein
MAYTTINKSTDYFNTKLYTGNGSTQSITGVDFQPDWVWIKQRNATNSHVAIDSVRGVLKRIRPDETNAEDTLANSLTAFGSDGFTLGSAQEVNDNSDTYVAWNWLADNTSGSSNTQGDITSTVSANTTSGFSIITYTGTGSAGTIGHGLGGTPDFWMTKARSETRAWYGWHTGINLGQVVNFNSTNAASTDTSLFTSNAPTSTVYNVGTSVGTNNSGITFVTYAFRSIKGFSKFGSYTGNGNDDGSFIYTGFKPAFVMFKNTSAAGDWTIQDSGRDTYNLADARLYANLNNTENDGTLGVDFLSNGIKIRTSSAGWNTSGNTYIYMAFAKAPLVGTNNIPATAR